MPRNARWPELTSPPAVSPPPKMASMRHVAAGAPSYRETRRRSDRRPHRSEGIMEMNVRAFLIAPAVLAVAILAGCGQGVPGAGAAQVRMPSTAACSAPDYIRDRAPADLCRTVVVDDDLSPLSGR